MRALMRVEGTLKNLAWDIGFTKPAALVEITAASKYSFGPSDALKRAADKVGILAASGPGRNRGIIPTRSLF